MIHTDFLFRNTIINCAFIAWFLAQFIKVLLSMYKGKLDLSRLTGAGGMPSSHTSTVLALTTAVYLTSGYQSIEFAIALTLSGIVMYDATGVRRAAGEQAKIINYMMENWADTSPKMFTKELKELLGHTPLEVIAGAILGVIIGIIFVRI
ncbi:MAG: divergent PAP2 family protein [Clostridia bacterium]